MCSLLHSPQYEILSGHVTQWFGKLPRLLCVPWNGTDTYVLESPSRVKNIKEHLERFPLTFPFASKGEMKDFGTGPILAVHDAAYVNHLQTIFDEWYSYPREVRRS